MGDELHNLASDPGEQHDLAEKHPDRVTAMQARLTELSAERPPLPALPILMAPALPYVYGRDENANVPAWTKEYVDAIRATQPQEWAPGTTPWPQAPKDGKMLYTGVAG